MPSGIFGPRPKYHVLCGSPCGVTTRPSTSGTGLPAAYAVAATPIWASTFCAIGCKSAVHSGRDVATESGSTPGGGGMSLRVPKPNPRGCCAPLAAAVVALVRAPRENPAPGRAPVLIEYETVYERGAFGRAA